MYLFIGVYHAVFKSGLKTRSEKCPYGLMYLKEHYEFLIHLKEYSHVKEKL